MAPLWAAWGLGVILVYAALFGVGTIIMGDDTTGLAMVGIAALAFLGIGRILSGGGPERFTR